MTGIDARARHRRLDQRHGHRRGRRPARRRFRHRGRVRLPVRVHRGRWLVPDPRAGDALVHGALRGLARTAVTWENGSTTRRTKHRRRPSTLPKARRCRGLTRNSPSAGRSAALSPTPTGDPVGGSATSSCRAAQTFDVARAPAADGSYQINGLVAGSYTVRFHDFEDRYPHRVVRQRVLRGVGDPGGGR